MKNTKTNLIDVTFLELTDAVMDVVARVKSGEAIVDVEHLTPDEQYAACKLLGLSDASWRASDALARQMAKAGPVARPAYIPTTRTSAADLPNIDPLAILLEKR